MESLRPPLPKYSKPSSPTHIDHHQINKRSIVDGDEIFKIPDNRYSSISTITNESSFDQSMMRSESDVSIVWSNLTQKDTNKRLQIMTELVQTEIKYVSDLTFLKTNYVDVLLARVDTVSEIIDKKTVHELFSYHGSILSVNVELKNQLTLRLTEWHINDCVGDIFTALTPFLRVYSLFLTNFSHALKLLSELEQNTRWTAFLKSVQSQGLGLQAYLLCPVQRIPRYKMLLEDLLKNTPIDHRDYEELKKGVEMVAQVCGFVNETIREHENMLSLVQIQRSLVGCRENLVVPGRKLLKKGKVFKICRRRHQVRQVFLFSDVLVYATPSVFEEQYHFYKIIPFEELKLVRGVSVGGDGLPNWEERVFHLVAREKSFGVYTRSVSESQEWCEAIEGAIRDYQNRDIVRDSIPRESPVPRSSLDGAIPIPRTEKREEPFDAPIWLPDSYTSECLICFKPFTLLRRKHHCRSCGTIVCHSCSSRTFWIQYRDGEKEARVCDTCVPYVSQKFRVGSPESVDMQRGNSIDSRSSVATTNRVSVIFGRGSMDSRRGSVDMRRPSVDMQRPSVDMRRPSILDVTSWVSKLIGTPKQECCGCRTLVHPSDSSNMKCKHCDRITCQSCLNGDSCPSCSRAEQWGF